MMWRARFPGGYDFGEHVSRAEYDVGSTFPGQNMIWGARFPGGYDFGEHVSRAEYD